MSPRIFISGDIAVRRALGRAKAIRRPEPAAQPLCPPDPAAELQAPAKKQPQSVPAVPAAIERRG